MAREPIKSTWEKYEKLLLAAVTLFGVALGNWMSRDNAQLLFLQQQNIQAMRQSYAKLAGLRSAWAQVQRRHAERAVDTAAMWAHIDTEKNPKERDRYLALHASLVRETNQLVDDAARTHREVSEAVGMGQAAFSSSAVWEASKRMFELRELPIDREVVAAQKTPKDIGNAQGLEKAKAVVEIAKRVAAYYDPLLDAMIAEIRSTTKE